MTLKSHSQNRQEAAPEGGQQRLYKAFFSTMVNHAKSQKLKKIEAATLKDMLNSLAIAQYKSEHADPAETERKLGRPPYTLRDLCDIIPKDYTHRTNKPAPSLSKSTLQRLLSGKIPKTKSAKQRSWLLESEVEVVVNYLLEMASRGFPLTQQRLKDVVDDICRARLGDQFPAGGVGKNWTRHFIEQYSDRLKTFWAAPLDSKRGRAVNPANNQKYFDLLRRFLQGNETMSLTKN